MNKDRLGLWLAVLVCFFGFTALLLYFGAGMLLVGYEEAGKYSTPKFNAEGPIGFVFTKVFGFAFLAFGIINSVFATILFVDARKGLRKRRNKKGK